MKGQALYAELQRTVEQLGLERDLHKALLGAQSDLGLAVLVSDGKRTIYSNDAAAHLTGRTSRELAQFSSFLDLFDEGPRKQIEAQLRKTPGAETVEVHQEVHVARPDGTGVDVELAAKALRRPDGILIVALLRDISGRKRSESALRRQTDLYNMLLSAQSDLGDGIAITEGGRFIHVNDALCQMYGYSRQELLALPNMLDLVPPDHRARVTERFRERLAGKDPGDRFELPIVRKDGRRIQVEYATKVIQHRPDLRLITILRDVTERHHATEDRIRRERDAAGQEAAERQRVRSAFLARAGEQLSSSLDLSTRLTEICQLALPQLADWAILETPDDAGELRPVAVSHVDPALLPFLERLTRGASAADRPDFGAAEVYKTGAPAKLFDLAARPDWARSHDLPARSLLGDLGLESAIVVPLPGRRHTLAVLTLGRGDRPPFDDDELAYALQYAQRAAVALENAQLYEERRRAEEDLRRHAAIVESSQDAIISFTADGIVVSWNPAAERIYGYRADEMVGRSLRHLLPEDRSRDFAVLLSAARDGVLPPLHETVHQTREGRRIEVSLSLAPLRDDEGALVGVCAMARDVTERKLVEEAFQRQRHQLARHLKEVEEVSRVGTALATSETPREVYDAALDAFQSLLGADHAAIVVAVPDRRPHVAATRGLPDDLVAALASHDPWAGASRRSFQFFNDVELDHRLVPLRGAMVRQGLNAVCHVPLDHRGVPAGYLLLASRRRGAFGKGDAWLCQTLGRMVAAARRLDAKARAEPGPDVAAALPVGAALVDRSGQVLAANPALATLVGVEPDALVGRALDAYVRSPIGRPPLRGVITTLRTEEGADILVRATAAETAEGATSWLFEDLTGHAAEADASLLADLLGRPGHAFAEISTDGTILRWGTGCSQAYGFSPREVEGTPYHALFPPKTNGAAAALLARAAAADRAQHEHTVRMTKAGQRHDVCLHLFGRLGDGARIIEVGLPGEECPRRTATAIEGSRQAPGQGPGATALLRR